jgi:hypothetical protein
MPGQSARLASPVFEFSNTLKTFGAVPVSPTNFFRLLQVGQAGAPGAQAPGAQAPGACSPPAALTCTAGGLAGQHSPHAQTATAPRR